VPQALCLGRSERGSRQLQALVDSASRALAGKGITTLPLACARRCRLRFCDVVAPVSRARTGGGISNLRSSLLGPGLPQRAQAERTSIIISGGSDCARDSSSRQRLRRALERGVRISE
jgi:hypothetical protein